MAAPKKRRPTAAEQEYAAATRANDAQYGRTRQMRGAIEKAGNAVGGLFGAPYAGKRAVTSPPGLAYQRMLTHDSDKRAFAAADALDRERAAEKGAAAVAQPKKPRAASAVPPPAKIDPVTGRSLSRGNPVATAYSGSPADRSRLFQSSALGAARATFKPPYLGAKGRVPDEPPAPRAVRDPVSGLPLKKGNPVHTAYSGDMNSRVALGLRTAGQAVGMAMKPPSLGAKGRVPNDAPAALPPARAPQVPTVDSVSRAKPNSPGYEDFPNSLAPGKKKRTGY